MCVCVFGFCFVRGGGREGGRGEGEGRDLWSVPLFSQLPSEAVAPDLILYEFKIKNEDSQTYKDSQASGPYSRPIQPNSSDSYARYIYT